MSVNLKELRNGSYVLVKVEFEIPIDEKKKKVSLEDWFPVIAITNTSCTIEILLQCSAEEGEPISIELVVPHAHIQKIDNSYSRGA